MKITACHAKSGTTAPPRPAPRLAGAGYSVTAIDVSGEAIGQSQARFGSMVRFMVADMTQRLPFPDGGFDAVMSNVAVHTTAAVDPLKLAWPHAQPR